MKTRSILTVLAALVVSTPVLGSAPAAAASIPAKAPRIHVVKVPGRSANAAFVTPTGNITCVMDAERGRTSTRCDISNSRWRLPRKPVSCDVDWGQGLELGRRASMVCAGDTTFGTAVLPGEYTGWFRSKRDVVVRYKRGWGDPSAGLRYGYALKVGDTTCRSAAAGVTCKNTAGHGFTMSRSAYRLF